MASVDSLLLVGSLPYDSTEDAFNNVPDNVKNKLSSLPDGETKNRSYFVKFQKNVFPKNVRNGTGWGGSFTAEPPLLASDMGYATAALLSYKNYMDQRSRRLVSPECRFQISLPNPLNSLWVGVNVNRRCEVEKWYESGMIRTVKSIQNSIPLSNLAIQWDCAIDFAYIEYERGRLRDLKYQPPFPSAESRCLDGLVRVSSCVDPAVRLGYHFCYGDMDHRHFVEPESLEVMVGYANNLFQRMQGKHEVAWIHMPVPKDRNDDTYFKPLRDLRLNDTKLYLGLIHANDEDGTRQKIAMAKKYAPNFGIATECGLGRTSATDVNSIFEISAAVCEQ